MAIYFYKNLVEKALTAIREGHELSDIRNDLECVRQQIEQVKYANLARENTDIMLQKLQQAKDLDSKVRKKYPVIDDMLNLANRIFPSGVFSGVNVKISETHEYKAWKI